jgi:hypothetical protein
MYFCKDERERLNQEIPGLSFKATAKELGNRWKSAPDQVKSKYNQLAAADKRRYETESAAYKKESAAQIQAPADARGRPKKRTKITPGLGITIGEIVEPTGVTEEETIVEAADTQALPNTAEAPVEGTTVEESIASDETETVKKPIEELQSIISGDAVPADAVTDKEVSETQ